MAAYAVIRGNEIFMKIIQLSCVKDGTRRKEWQQYAALLAACVTATLGMWYNAPVWRPSQKWPSCPPVWRPHKTFNTLLWPHWACHTTLHGRLQRDRVTRFITISPSFKGPGRNIFAHDWQIAIIFAMVHEYKGACLGVFLYMFNNLRQIFCY